MAISSNSNSVPRPIPDIDLLMQAIEMRAIAGDDLLDIPHDMAMHLLHAEVVALPGPPDGPVGATTGKPIARDPAAAISIRRHNRSLHATRIRNAVQRRHDLRRAMLSQSLPQSASLASHSVAAPGWAGSDPAPGARPMNCQREKRLPMRRTMASAVLRAAAVKRTRELHEHMLAAY
jgi:hypothetical protein